MNALLLVALMASSRDTAWRPLARLVESEIAQRAFPGAVVAIGRADTVLYLHAFGHLDYEHGRPVTTRTVYDLASLTKVVGLTTAMMQLVASGQVELDAPAVRYVPPFRDSAVTVRQLLTHSSGLPAWKPFYQTVAPGGGRPDGRSDAARRRMLELVDAEPLETPPGTKMVYSDLGAMVMTQIVEHVTGQRLDRYLKAHVFAPLGMRETRYLPPRAWLPRIAPTERDTTWRHRLVRGEVHDENAASMGGISGHAGLFSTAPDLARFARAMLGCFPVPAAGAHSHARALPRSRASRRRAPFPADCATVREFTAIQRPGFSSRALGWDTPSEGSSAGSRLSPRAFGHTGFTGTSIWMDPEQDLFVILLTNRVYPTRENHLIAQARRAVADTASAIAARRR